jgi:septum formation protein
MHAPHLVLASGSPRRRELLSAAGFRFEIDAADLDETIHDGEAAVAATARLAIEKAEAVVARRAFRPELKTRPHGEIVLAADTTVVLGERILGKPVDHRDAVEMLLSLSGRNHLVLTAWALMPVGPSTVAPECGLTRSIVRMGEISRREAERYAAAGEPMDKAGAYAAQGEGRRFIAAIVGPLDNVIGLPMAPVVAALERAGVVPT